MGLVAHLAALIFVRVLYFCACFLFKKKYNSNIREKYGARKFAKDKKSNDKKAKQ